MKSDSLFNSKRILVLLLLILAGGAIYELPYLRYYYYDALQAALELNHTQYGTLMTAYGVTAMICYFPGGWLADKFSCKKLIVFALLATAALGFYFSTFPSYIISLLIHILWGITTSLIFWAAMLKATRMSGGSEIQGKLFGILEGGRGLLPMIWGMAILTLFNYLGGEIAGIRGAILAYSGITLLAGFLILFFFKERKVEDESDASTEKGNLKEELLYVLKLPGLWLLAVIIFACYTLYCTQSYITPYFTEMFGAGASLAALIALIRTYFIAIFGGPIAGIWADKIGSTVKVLRIGLLVASISVLAYLIIPARESFLWLATIAMVVLAFSVFLTRGVYFAAIDELAIPLKYTGAAIGLASFIGFIPEAFVYTLVGHWLDSYPGITGYKIMFTYMLIVGLIGFVFSFILIARIKKKQKLTKAGDD
ncbi:MAG TPA: MFS transporter [Firmicutes bacterium]|nr:MFS transporter [Bacillota bacterium]